MFQYVEEHLIPGGRPGLSMDGKVLDRGREPEVAIGQSSRIVRRQGDFDAVPDIGPFRMMIHFFRDQCDLCHESPRLIEIAELECLRYRRPFVEPGPAGKLLERRVGLGIRDTGYGHEVEICSVLAVRRAYYFNCEASGTSISPGAGSSGERAGRSRSRS